LTTDIAPILCEDCLILGREREARFVVVDIEAHDVSYQCDNCKDEYIEWLKKWGRKYKWYTLNAWFGKKRHVKPEKVIFS